MNKIFIKAVSIIAASMLVISISACSGGNKQGDSTVQQSSGTTGSTIKVSSNFNPTGLPIMKEAITLRFMVSHPNLAKKNFSEKDWYKEVSQKTNVNIQWEEIAGSSFAEKVNLVINSGDLPDGIYAWNSPNLNQAIDAGYVLPLDEYIEKFAPNQRKINQLYPLTKSAPTYTSDGKRYYYAGIGLKPEAAVRAPLFMNKVWLDKVGLKIPTTLDELYAVLKAFKTKDPNGNGKADEIPLSFVKDGDNFYDMLAIWGIIDVKTKFHTGIKNGKLFFNPTDTRYRDALRYFNKLYSEGLLDAEFLTQDGNQQKAKISLKPTVVGVFPGYDNSRAGANASEFTVIPPVKGPSGDQLWPYNPNETDIYMGLLLFKSCKYPEAAIRWVDYLNDGVNAIINNFGPENLSWKRDEAAKTWTTLDAELVKKGLTIEDMVYNEGTQNGPQMTKVNEITGYKFIPVEGSRDANKMNWSALYKPFFNKEYWPSAMPIAPVTDESKNITLLQNDFETYFSSFLADAMMKGLDDQKWDAFLKKCKELQTDKIVAYYQTMYDNAIKLQK